MRSVRENVRRPGPAASLKMRAEILERAEQLFALRGFEGTSLDQIADAVGIRRPSLLHYFRSKREIYDTVEADIVSSLTAATTPIPVTMPPLDALMALLQGWLEVMLNRPTVARIVLRNTTDFPSRVLERDPLQFMDVVVHRFETIIQAGQRDGSFRTILPMVVLNILAPSVVHYVCSADQLGGGRAYNPADPDTLVEFMAGLRRAADGLLSSGRSST